MNGRYKIKYQTPSIDAFNQLRVEAGLSSKEKKAIEIGLPNTLFAVTIYDEDTLIGLGRVVGDGGVVFHVVDIVVKPSYQGQGIGKKVMEEITDYLDAHAYQGSFVSLIADIPADKLYEQFGFQYTAPNSVGMYRMYK
ncbi:GNAT family N-acetyltransferase [Oceanobacillus jeddahense]|uniref:GNAT family N-acetyltransferase n=1 Tax=Oceanobacillus jeddahense TaxID=1462527 RepID=A0ABY5JTY8_9BACI|nr:GNAT family N-acetyltransferase [Oceanobacillus jeddahense]UUI02049.1 GNAT family N-acetyltransferase [Oceanobacillus jeddahense]